MLYNLIAVAAKLSLVAVIGLAGGAKLVSFKKSQVAMSDFGFAAWIAKPLGVTLPFVEIVVAIALLYPQSATVGALFALVLFLLFNTVIIFNIAHGRRPVCHCFGELNSVPVGRAQIIRNFGFALLAILSIRKPHPSITLVYRVLIRPGSTVQLLIGVSSFAIVCAILWITFNLRNRNRHLVRQIEAHGTTTDKVLQHGPSRNALAMGTPAFQFELPNVRGGRSTLAEFLHLGKPILVIFSDPACGACSTLLPEIADWHKTMASELTVVVISRGQADANKYAASSSGLEDWMYVSTDEEVQHLVGEYRLSGTPTAVLIRSDGMIGSQTILGPDLIRDFVSKLASVKQRRLYNQQHREVDRRREGGGGVRSTDEAR